MTIQDKVPPACQETHTAVPLGAACQDTHTAVPLGAAHACSAPTFQLYL